ncbi:MAG: cytochrome c maturation protein CcmE [Deltaproteobacteria bacterium]|nr:cytochrome c maturation protein CcmE [Deltaproteobacteria bacterium]
MAKKNKNLKPIIISVVILAVVGYLVYAGLRDTMTYYLTVSEVLANPPEVRNENTVRVGGNVTPDSVKWDPKSLRLDFKIEDMEGSASSLKVSYKGVVPDSFKPGIDVLLEGKYKGDGKFAAAVIMPKCGSKYE